MSALRLRWSRVEKRLLGSSTQPTPRSTPGSRSSELFPPIPIPQSYIPLLSSHTTLITDFAEFREGAERCADRVGAGSGGLDVPSSHFSYQVLLSTLALLRMTTSMLLRGPSPSGRINRDSK